MRFCGWLLFTFLSTSAFSVENTLSRCVSLEDNFDRLRCYDALAGRNTVRQAQSQDEPENQMDSTDPVDALVVTSKLESLEATTVENGNFGKKPEISVEEGEQISSIITAVTKSPRGGRVITLASGQVWMEDEAGKRKIEIDQNVTIAKRRWRYVMRMKSGPVVAVHRID